MLGVLTGDGWARGLEELIKQLEVVLGDWRFGGWSS